MPHGYVHRALYTLAALVAVGICVAAAALLWVDRRGTWDAAYVASRNLADGWPAPSAARSTSTTCPCRA